MSAALTSGLSSTYLLQDDLFEEAHEMEGVKGDAPVNDLRELLSKQRQDGALFSAAQAGISWQSSVGEQPAADDAVT